MQYIAFIFRCQAVGCLPALGVGFENYVAHLGHEVVRLLVRTIRDRSTEEAVGPLLCEPARASEDDGHLRVANAKPAEHIRQPGSPSCLGPKEIGVIAFDHDCRSWHLREALQLKRQATIGKGSREVLERLALDNGN